MSVADDLASRLRRPEYTGENRCLPCTVVNLVLAAGASVAVAVGLAWTGTGPPVAAGVGLATFGVCCLPIYFRGYLVPGTPTLTKRYLPDRVLALFGKGPASGREPIADEDFDPERALIAMGAVEECQDGADLCLTEDFRRDWNAEIERVEGRDTGRRRLLDLLDVPDGDVEIEEFDGAFRARIDGQLVGTWESEAAFRADLAAGRVLAERESDWNRRPVGQRGRLLNGLRLFVDTCPACGGDAAFDTDTVESCCSTHEVAAVSCADCGARLFESQPL